MGSYGNFDGDAVTCNGFHSYTPPQLGRKQSPSWFDVRVFYVRISNGAVDDSTPESLTLNHIPLDPDTLLEVNCSRCGTNSDGVSSSLRRDRLDKKFEEVTYVSTDNIRFTGSVRFQVFNGEDNMLSGVLELCSSNDNNGELRNHDQKWSLRFESELVTRNNFLKVQHRGRPEVALPTIEVYVAGCFSGAPIILTKTLQLNTQKKKSGRSALDLMPGHEMIGTENDANGLNADPSRLDLQVNLDVVKCSSCSLLVILLEDLCTSFRVSSATPNEKAGGASGQERQESMETTKWKRERISFRTGGTESIWKMKMVSSHGSMLEYGLVSGLALACVLVWDWDLACWPGLTKRPRELSEEGFCRLLRRPRVRYSGQAPKVGNFPMFWTGYDDIIYCEVVFYSTLKMVGVVYLCLVTLMNASVSGSLRSLPSVEISQAF